MQINVRFTNEMPVFHMFQKTALWGFIFGAALLTAYLPITAQAAQEPELSFYPAKGWVVRTKPLVSAPTQGRQCYLTSEFNNGFYMQFSGNGKQIDRISFDFRQNVFAANESYNAMLAVPGQMQEKTTANAISDNVITIDLNKVPGVLDKMRSASVLDLHVEENRFRFYLTALSSALGSYESCASEKAPAASEPVPVAKASQPKAKPEKAMEEIIEQQTRETAALDAGKPVPLEIKIDESEPADAGTDFPDQIKGRRLSTLLASKMEGKPADAGAPSIAAVQEVTPEATEEPVADGAKADPATPAPVVEVEEVAAVAPEAVEPVTPAPTRTNYKTPWPEEKRSSGQMEIDVSAAGIGKNGKPQSGKVYSYDAAVEEMTRANEGREQNDAETEALRRKIRELEKTVSRLETDNRVLGEKVEETEVAEVLPPEDNSGVDISTDNWDLERATMRYNEAERQIKRLGRELAKERARAAAEKEELQAMLFDPQVTSQQQIAKLAELEEQLSEAQIKLAEQKLRFEERIRTLESQLSEPAAQ